VLVPLAIPLAMKAVFRATTRQFGPQRGYQAGFAVYWATCWGVAAALVGPRRLAALWHPGDTALPDRRSLAVTVLVVPPLGAIMTQWVPNARDAGPVAIATAAGVGPHQRSRRGGAVARCPCRPLPRRPCPRMALARPGLHRVASRAPDSAAEQRRTARVNPGRCWRHRPGIRVDRIPDAVPASRLPDSCDNRRQRGAASPFQMALIRPPGAAGPTS